MWHKLNHAIICNGQLFFGMREFSFRKKQNGIFEPIIYISGSATLLNIISQPN